MLVGPDDMDGANDIAFDIVEDDAPKAKSKKAS